MRTRFSLLTALVLILAACGTPEPTETLPVEPFEYPIEVEPEPEPRLSFCQGLRAIQALERSDYADLRRTPRGAGVWDGALTLPGLRFCQIEGPGGDYPQAQYACYGDVALSDPLPRLRVIEAAVDSCLNVQTAETERRWQKSEPLTLSASGYSQLWLDKNSWPRSVVVLQLDPGPDMLEPQPAPRLLMRYTTGGRYF